MLRIHQLKLHYRHTEAELRQKIAKTLHLSEADIQDIRIVKQSMDARKKPELFYVYTVDVSVPKEQRLCKQLHNNQIQLVTEQKYAPKITGTEALSYRPVIIGSGPAGLFCAYMLAQYGYRPILLERGACVEERSRDVEAFWKTGMLNPESNVQFGEGGAGTFSDGKLNTLVKDAFGRNKKVLELFVKHGAPEEILYINKPHIGTDILTTIVKQMREEILRCGGEVRFHSKVTDFQISHGRCTGVVINETEQLPCDVCVLAIGHSARDTFSLLFDKQVPMEAKSFAVGVRVEHLQTTINQSQYGIEDDPSLPAAAYKLAEQLDNGRGVYSFCMCPGGYVVNASSEEHRLAINGMSYHDRAGTNANSAMIVTVTPSDYGSDHPLAGIAFQRALEEKAYQIGGGSIPVQLYRDFCRNQVSTDFGSIRPEMKGSYTFANVRSIFPEEIAASLAEGIARCNRKIQGFSDDDVLLSGVESRTSSPVRITRDETLSSEIKGLYPCGEGAGYAGGITSAAMDGLKVFEKMIECYKPYEIFQKTS